MKQFFDGKEMRKLDARREAKKLSIVEYRCKSCGHDRAFRYETGRVKCSRCGGVTWE